MSEASVGAALARGRDAGLDRLDAMLLLGHVLGRDRTWLIAHGDDGLSVQASTRFDTLCARRAAGEPLAYLVGEREFHGLSLRVDAAVLVPRPDTETLVDWALSLLRSEWTSGPPPRVADLGTGSGAIALAVKHGHPNAEVDAVDLSEAALVVARDNAARLGLPVRFHAGSWWQPLAGRHFDLVLSNPPYIAANDPHLAALAHEPALALTPGGDGLGAIRTIVAGAPVHMAPGAWLLFEHGWDQAEPVATLLAASGFADIDHRQDLAGHTRCTGARWAGQGTSTPTVEGPGHM